MSSSIKEIATSLAAFQGEVGKIRKDSTNPFFKSKYASLANILDVIRDPLVKNGLSFTQFPTGDYELTTILMHTSGEFIQGTYRMKPKSELPHDQGSAISYQKRYALSAILGLSIDEDDDGNIASGTGTASGTGKQAIKTVSAQEKPKDVELEPAVSMVERMDHAYREIEACHTLYEVIAVWNKYADLQCHDTFRIKCTNRKGQLSMNQKKQA